MPVSRYTRYIRETGEAFRAAWRLKLPASGAWIRAGLPDLLRWANGFSLDATFGLGRAVLVAAAHLQQGSELRFLWLRACEDAAQARLRHRLGAAWPRPHPRRGRRGAVA